MNQQPVEVGVKIRVSNPTSPHYGRTGYVDELVSYVGGAGGRFRGPPESRGWRVIFDWPLGGVVTRLVLREQELEVIPRL